MNQKFYDITGFVDEPIKLLAITKRTLQNPDFWWKQHESIIYVARYC